MRIKGRRAKTRLNLTRRSTEAKLQTQSLSAYGLTNAAQYVHAHSLRISISPRLSLFLCLPKGIVIAQKLLFHGSKKKKTGICCVLGAGVAIKLFNQRIVGSFRYQLCHKCFSIIPYEK